MHKIKIWLASWGYPPKANHTAGRTVAGRIAAYRPFCLITQMAAAILWMVAPFWSLDYPQHPEKWSALRLMLGNIENMDMINVLVGLPSFWALVLSIESFSPIADQSYFSTEGMREIRLGWLGFIL